MNNLPLNNECVSDIHNQTNQRIYGRNIPSQMLQEVGGKVLDDALPRILEIEKKYQKH